MFSRESQARAIRYAAVLFALYVAGAWVYLASGQPKGAKLADRMTKDQLAFVEKIEDHKTLQRQSKAAEGIRKGELLEKIKANRKALAADLSNKLRAGEIKGWAFTCTDLDTHSMAVAMPDRLEVSIDYKGLPEKVREVVRTLRRGDIILLSLRTGKPEVTVQSGSAFATTTAGIYAPGSSVVAIEKPR